MKKALLSCLVLVFALSLVAGCSQQQPAAPAKTEPPKNTNLILATTTSTQDSGLLEVLIPLFEKKSGYKVKTVAVGTGAALQLGEKGEADVMLVHAPADEKKLVDAGVMTNYQLVMHNDFIIVGPDADAAKIKGVKTAADAFTAISKAKANFVSRGDNSGTHTKEKEIWAAAKVTPAGTWYIQSGAGMGQTLTIASEKKAYTLADRATYLAQKKNIQLSILVAGDGVLLNIYHVGQVSVAKFPKVNADGAKAFVEFMVAADTQKVIGEFGKDKYGEALFFPDAGKSESSLTGGK
jgi:tungstate transport system substrate-binding protein